MIKKLQITILAENTVRRPGLLSEHGWSVWIEADERRILFDTGQGLVLRHNVDKLDIPLETAHLVALSHGHFDHTGGLSTVFGFTQSIDLYLHPAALEEKYRREKTPPHRAIGIPKYDEPSLREQTNQLIWTSKPTKLAEDIFLTGEIPRRNDFEDTGGAFYLDADCTKPDPLLDDQALWIETSGGIVVILGCAHSGVVNTLDYIAELTGNKQIRAVLGGMHLIKSGSRRIDATIDALKQYQINKIGASHCTGMRATTRLWSEFPESCVECSVGTTLCFN